MYDIRRAELPSSALSSYYPEHLFGLYYVSSWNYVGLSAEYSSMYRYKSHRFVYSFALAQDMIHVKRQLRKLFTRDGARVLNILVPMYSTVLVHNMYLPWCVYPSLVYLCAEDEFTISRVHPASTFRTGKNTHTCYDISIT